MLIQRIRDLLLDGVRKRDFPGCSFGLVINDEIFIEHLGYKQIYQRKILTTKKDIYDVASLTKVISTTTIIMKLIEEKTISFDSKASDILPRFKHDKITVYHLLTHSSGLPADITKAKTLKTKENVLDKLYECNLIYEPGSNTIYSDLGFILLGEIIEKVCQKPINLLAEEIIFKPLQMNNTTYKPDRRYAAPTEFRDDEVYRGLLRGKVHDEKAYAMKGISGHAGLFSTAYDIALFMKAIINKSFVLNERSMDSLFSRQINNRALGYEKPKPNGICGDNFDFANTICHTGFTGCHMLIDRKKKTGFVLLSNAVHFKREMNNIFPYRYQIGNLIFEELGGTDEKNDHSI